ncbi:MAG: hypothetical protein ACFBSD_15425 [Paracoccaceae bacterium]
MPAIAVLAANEPSAPAPLDLPAPGRSDDLFALAAVFAAVVGESVWLAGYACPGNPLAGLTALFPILAFGLFALGHVSRILRPAAIGLSLGLALCLGVGLVCNYLPG